jgi:dTDP-4-dehydrorhamnose 3,5-epimerase
MGLRGFRMKFIDLDFGARMITAEPFIDSRGSLSRIFCEKEFGEQGLAQRWAQSGVTVSKKGAVRGLHGQPGCSKFYFVLKGEIYDVLVNIGGREWIARLYLPEGSGVYIPDNVYHGFQALTDDALVLWYTSDFYRPEIEQRLRYDYIKWPIEVTEISEKDRT